jgi:hypothetical protein
VVAAVTYRVCVELQRGEPVERDRKSAEAEADTAAAAAQPRLREPV